MPLLSFISPMWMILLVMILAVSGCRTEPESSPDVDSDAQTDPSDERTVTLLALSQGDRACYLTVDDGSGVEREELAVFELCSRNDLVGREIRLNTRLAPVQALSCAGDPDCTESDTVAIIDSVWVVE